MVAKVQQQWKMTVKKKNHLSIFSMNRAMLYVCVVYAIPLTAITYEQMMTTMIMIMVNDDALVCRLTKKLKCRMD